MLKITHYQRNTHQNHNEVHLTLVRMATIKKVYTINPGDDVEKTKPSYTVGGIANWYSHYGEQCGDSLKNWK